MKRTTLTALLALLISGMVLIGCSSDTEKNKKIEEHTHDSAVVTKQYYCPMECMGDTLFDKPGTCPECGMDLVEKK